MRQNAQQIIQPGLAEKPASRLIQALDKNSCLAQTIVDRDLRMMLVLLQTLPDARQVRAGRVSRDAAVVCQRGDGEALAEKNLDAVSPDPVIDQAAGQGSDADVLRQPGHCADPLWVWLPPRAAGATALAIPLSGRQPRDQDVFMQTPQRLEFGTDHAGLPSTVDTDKPFS